MAIKLKYLMGIILTFITTAFLSSYAFAKNTNSYENDPDTITVYTRNTFLKEDGPSKYLEDLFYDKYKGKIQWISVDSSVNINQDFPNYSGVDVVMGMSSLEMNALAGNGQLLRIETNNYPKTTVDQKHYNSKYYIPFESFQLSFIYNKEKIKNPPTTLLGLITNPNYTLIIEDPTANTLGLNLLYWINDLYKNKIVSLINTLYKHALIETSQTSAFNKFSLAGGDFVLDYSTKPSMEELVNQNTKYKALMFKNGNLEIHNYVGITSNTMKENLAHDFISMLLSQNGQKIIAYKHYSYPALEKDIDLLNTLTKYKNQPIYINPEKFVRNTPLLKRIWNRNLK